MKLQKLHIKNFKSIVDLELVNPSPFSVFVGPNGAGKSNIFEALEFFNFAQKFRKQIEVIRVFGPMRFILPFSIEEGEIYFNLNFENFPITLKINAKKSDTEGRGDRFVERNSSEQITQDKLRNHEEYKQFITNFSRIFIGNYKIQRIDYVDNLILASSVSNLESVLSRLLQFPELKKELNEWLQLLIPDFSNIEISTTELSGINELAIFDKNFPTKPFTKKLISDGTYNILSLLTAVFQSDEPQFLCIEEPENGLHPQVIMTLVEFFRQQCEEKGHYIWLNTHSESLVRKLRPEEIILVDKREGETKVKQVRDMNLYDLPTDEAWLTGALGGGLPW